MHAALKGFKVMFGEERVPLQALCTCRLHSSFDSPQCRLRQCK
ncbi:hypothetical protein XOCgx_4751 [Xanthomonas oryzae pv. oryzicola]|nr:hypothetical protein XOCgx_4751 [Xanthomonas oryzae pv. oryzicola]